MLRDRALEFAQRNGGVGAFAQADGLNAGVLVHTRPTPLSATIYQPIICLILQGSKELSNDGRLRTIHAGECLIISHDLSVTGRVPQASRALPYVSVVALIDMEIVRSLHNEVHGSAGAEDDVPLGIARTDPELSDALARYLALADDPQARNVLAPLIEREIHYRLLTAPNGGMLRRMIRHDSHASRIAVSLRLIREQFRAPLPVSVLAEAAAMSVSSFHEHFSAVTGTTPLRYQKDLRLLEAQRILSEGTRSVSQTAFDVGYESPTQFSREYARKFGHSPKHHIRRPLDAL